MSQNEIGQSPREAPVASARAAAQTPRLREGLHGINPRGSGRPAPPQHQRQKSQAPGQPVRQRQTQRRQQASGHARKNEILLGEVLRQRARERLEGRTARERGFATASMEMLDPARMDLGVKLAGAAGKKALFGSLKGLGGDSITASLALAGGPVALSAAMPLVALGISQARKRSEAQTRDKQSLDALKRIDRVLDRVEATRGPDGLRQLSANPQAARRLSRSLTNKGALKREDGELARSYLEQVADRKRRTADPLGRKAASPAPQEKPPAYDPARLTRQEEERKRRTKTWREDALELA